MDNIDEDIPQSDYYDVVETPANASKENKNGVTFRGSDNEYFKAKSFLIEMTKKKGDRFQINGVEIYIADNPNNKPITIGIKPKNGISGKANLKIYSKNRRGNAAIMVTKVRGGNTEDVKNLAFKVVNYILDNVILGHISLTDMEKMRISNNKSIEKCKGGGKYAVDEKIEKCDRSGKVSMEKENSNEHIQRTHSEIRSPDSKKLRTDQECNEGCEEKTEEDEIMDVDDDLVSLSNKKDEKVLLMQKRFDEEEEKIKENKIKTDMRIKEEDKKTKNRSNSEKKKNKKKEDKTRLEEQGEVRDHSKRPLISNTKDIPTKYAKLMKEAGLDITEYEIFSVEGDGACGSTCTAVHCHRDKKLSKYVRRNVNEYLVKFWPFFEEFMSFPLTIRVGLSSQTFEDDQSFLKFLKSDQKSGLIWMDHLGLQAVSNMYQITVHILTTGVSGMEEPKARWTHLTPDTRLVKFSTIHKGLPDMWLIHSDEIHFDLMIRKNSELAIEGSVGDLLFREKTVHCKESEKYLEANRKVGNHEAKHRSLQSFACELCDESFLDKSKLKAHVKCHNDSEELEDHGPGYMGWRIKDTEDKDIDKIRIEVKSLRNELNSMKNEVEKKEKKQITELKKEVIELKEEFKQCMIELRKETTARNEAETMIKVLKDTIEANKELEKETGHGEMEVDNDDNDEKWEQQRSQRIKMKKRARNDSVLDSNTSIKDCNKSAKHSKTYAEAAKQGKNHESDNGYDCTLCNIKFKEQSNLRIHMKVHNKLIRFECSVCKTAFKTKLEIKQHEAEHRFKKRDKFDMCENNLQDAQNIKEHQQEHAREFGVWEQSEKYVTNKTRLKEQADKFHVKEFRCEQCSKIFAKEQGLIKHKESHEQKLDFVCTECGKAFCDNSGLVEHMQYHEVMEHKCEKCDKVYTEMRKLRRHDWRSHRSIECTICSEILENRQEISQHRQNIHRMFRKMTCKYYPDCLDGDECLFEHISNQENIKEGCPNGQACKDQECVFNEKEHINPIRDGLCKFQEKCNRIFCSYKHIFPRKSFLGAGPIEKTRK